MDLNSFQSKPAWLQGGIKGVIICVLLFLCYLLVYYPIIGFTYTNEETPAWVDKPPMYTGHFFPLVSGFIVPYGFLCEFTEPGCNRWTSEKVPNCVPWVEVDAGKIYPGCCLEQSLAPTDSCARISEWLGFAGLMLLLMAIYFVIGAILSQIIHRK